jgi:hypothetical protein
MLLVTLVLKALSSISQNGISPIRFNKQLSNHIIRDIINASIFLSSFPFGGCFQSITDICHRKTFSTLIKVILPSKT